MEPITCCGCVIPAIALPDEKKQMFPQPDIHHESSCREVARLETVDRYKAPSERVMKLFLHDTGRVITFPEHAHLLKSNQMYFASLLI